MPSAWPLPARIVPLDTVMPPEKLFAAPSVSMPLPSFARPPAPDTVPPYVRLSERLKARAAPLPTLTGLESESEPVVPPLPIWSTPAETVVVPV